MLSVYIKQLENFAGTMNFVIFPMFFLSTALYPLWKMQESGAQWIYVLTRFNPFTHAIEALRFALYGQIEITSLAVVAASTTVFYLIAAIGYDPQRGLIKSG
jgi:ABC-2 type transport system permease protein